MVGFNKYRNLLYSALAALLVMTALCWAPTPAGSAEADPSLGQICAAILLHPISSAKIYFRHFDEQRSLRSLEKSATDPRDLERLNKKIMLMKIENEAERDQFVIDIYRKSGGTLYRHFLRNKRQHPVGSVASRQYGIHLIAARNDLLFFGGYIRNRLKELSKTPNNEQLRFDLTQTQLDYFSYESRNIF